MKMCLILPALLVLVACDGPKTEPQANQSHNLTEVDNPKYDDGEYK